MSYLIKTKRVIYRNGNGTIEERSGVLEDYSALTQNYEYSQIKGESLANQGPIACKSSTAVVVVVQLCVSVSVERNTGLSLAHR